MVTIEQKKLRAVYTMEVKDYEYRSYSGEADIHYFVNKITNERRPITEAQYEDRNYTLNNT